MSLSLLEENFDSPDAARLVAALDAELALAYAPHEMFGKNLRPAHLEEGRGLFIIARLDGKAVGCGALRRLDDSTAEVKRMYVDPDVRGRGVARTVLDHLTDAARRLGVGRLVLETGVHQAAAISLYRRAGFAQIDCWGEYAAASTSVCFERTI